LKQHLRSFQPKYLRGLAPSFIPAEKHFQAQNLFMFSGSILAATRRNNDKIQSPPIWLSIQNEKQLGLNTLMSVGRGVNPEPTAYNRSFSNFFKN